MRKTYMKKKPTNTRGLWSTWNRQRWSPGEVWWEWATRCQYLPSSQFRRLITHDLKKLYRNWNPRWHQECKVVLGNWWLSCKGEELTSVQCETAVALWITWLIAYFMATEKGSMCSTCLLPSFNLVIDCLPLYLPIHLLQQWVDHIVNMMVHRS